MMDDQGAENFIAWFAEVESRFCKVLRTVPLNATSEDVFLPSLSSMILEACSLIDTLFRDGYQGTARSRSLTISDFAPDFERRFGLSEMQTLVFNYPLSLLSPYRGWVGADGRYSGLDWWKAYNALKHDRLANFDRSTIRTLLLSLCALHQLIAREAVFLEPLLRREMLCCQRRDLENLVAELRGEGPPVHTGMMESELFGTPVGRLKFPSSLSKIDPHQFGGRKLQRFCWTRPKT